MASDGTPATTSNAMRLLQHFMAKKAVATRKIAPKSYLDHIVARNATAVSGGVLDFGTLAIDDELVRIEENFRRTGSDHYPITAKLKVP
jgi:hypothetical protein